MEIKTKEEQNNFQQFVLNKCLDHNMYIYGPAVRDIIWASIFLPQFDTTYSNKKWDELYKPETIYKRLGLISELNVIVSHNNFGKFVELMHLFISHTLINEELPISELDTLDTCIRYITIWVKPPWNSSINSIVINALLCENDDTIENIEGIISNNCQFECNQLCMRKYKNKVETSVLFNSSIDKLANIIGYLNIDQAMLTKSINYHNSTLTEILHMAAYGFYTQFDQIDGIDIFVFMRSNDSEQCLICENKTSNAIGKFLYLRIGNNIYHINCYLDICDRKTDFNLDELNEKIKYSKDTVSIEDIHSLTIEGLHVLSSYMEDIDTSIIRRK